MPGRALRGGVSQRSGAFRSGHGACNPHRTVGVLWVPGFAGKNRKHALQKDSTRNMRVTQFAVLLFSCLQGLPEDSYTFKPSTSLNRCSRWRCPRARLTTSPGAHVLDVAQSDGEVVTAMQKHRQEGREEVAGATSKAKVPIEPLILSMSCREDHQCSVKKINHGHTVPWVQIKSAK